jgi:stearoyl-CoA desaturase (Delta-9 desaturase)
MVGEILKTIQFHYKEGNVNWPMLVYVSLVHILALIGIPTIAKCSSETLIWAFLCWPIR